MAVLSRDTRSGGSLPMNGKRACNKAKKINSKSATPIAATSSNAFESRTEQGILGRAATGAQLINVVKRASAFRQLSHVASAANGVVVRGHKFETPSCNFAEEKTDAKYAVRMARRRDKRACVQTRRAAQWGLEAVLTYGDALGAHK